MRPTKDLDFLALGSNDQQEMIGIFQEICSVPVTDGVVFASDSAQIERIREQTEYGGLRISINAAVEQAKVRVLIDIAFGDAIEPGLQQIDLPVILDFPAPHLRAYAPETVIAEKFQAMIVLGRANSRMKDLYDIWALSGIFDFKDDKLPRAIAATFARRKTDIPSELPDALTAGFANDSQKVQQWNSFIADVAYQPGTLADVIKHLVTFLMPHAAAARRL